MFWNISKSPITLEDQQWLEDSFIELAKLFGSNQILAYETVLPNEKYFDWNFTGAEVDAENVLQVVCEYMHVDISKIKLIFYSEEEVQFTDEGLITQPDKDDKRTAGKYKGAYIGKYDIMLEIQQLKNPVNMIATLAHEVAHIKLLGERRIFINDEPLTDLTTYIFGFGLFSANSSVIKMNTWSGNTHSGWRISRGGGYLHFKIHSYALALLTLIRSEETTWFNYCEKEIASNVKKALKYMDKLDLDSFMNEVKNHKKLKVKIPENVRLKKRKK